MPQYRIQPGNAPASVSIPETGATVTNLGPATVFYGSSRSITDTVNDGSVASSSSVSLTGSSYFFVPRTSAGCDILVVPTSTTTTTRTRSKIHGTEPLATGHNHHAGPQGATAQNSGNARISHVLLADVNAIRFNYVNWVQQGSSDPAASIDVWAAFEVAATGTIVPMTFNGLAKGTIDPGGDRWTDWIAPGDLAKGSILWSRSHVETAGASIPAIRKTQTALGEGSANGAGLTNLALAGSAAIGASTNTPAYCPSIVQCQLKNGQTRTWVAIVGDSIADGTGDALNGLVDRGYLARAMERDLVPYVQVTMAGETALQYGTIATSRRRRKLSLDADIVFNEYGINDVIAGSALSVVQANVLAVHTMYANRGALVYGQTLTPKVALTDPLVGGSTLGNQVTQSYETVRVNFNNWVRDGSPIDATTKVAVAVGTTSNTLRAGDSGHPLAAHSSLPKGFIEIADVCESARDSGKWKTPGTSGTGDTTGSSTTITNFVGNIAVGQIVCGANVVVSSMVYSSVAGTLTLNATTTGSATGTAYAGAYTTDGTHPSAAMHDLMMAAIPSAVTA